MTHPILIRLGTRMALSHIAAEPTIPTDAQAAPSHIWRLGLFHDVASEVELAMLADPAGAAALNAPAPVPPTPIPVPAAHPIIAWILANWKTVYAIVATILAAFGIVVPPIP